MYRLVLGDCIEEMKKMDSNSIDCIVTDPPYEIGFMDKSFDKTGIAFRTDVWKEALRVLKPGGYLLAFGFSRTYHRMTCAIEDAGFEVRDCLMWIYSVGFPKSHNVGLGIDKFYGSENRGRAIPSASVHFPNGKYAEEKLTGNKVEEYVGKTELGKKYSGYGTALKPAYEPILMCRKPLVGTVAKNVIEYGTGGINIDACRVSVPEGEDLSGIKPRDITKLNTKRNDETEEEAALRKKNGTEAVEEAKNKLISLGRFPANVIHDGSDEVLSLFPDTKSSSGSFKASDYEERETATPFTRGDFVGYGDKGSAARFFYCAKASKKDRNEGCESLQEKQYSSDGREKEIENAFQRNKSVSNNNHPTVKPTSLMRYLVRLVCPEGGTVLDPFNGSGSTGKAAILEGFSYIGIEMDPDYITISECRLKHAEEHRND